MATLVFVFDSKEVFTFLALCAFRLHATGTTTYTFMS